MDYKESKVKIAVIGAGYWGANLVRVTNELGYLKSVCDKNIDNLNKIKQKFPNLKTTPNIEDILNDNEITGIINSLPAELHYKITKEAILSGKDVFVEKPLALNLEEANELSSISTKHNKIIMVGHLLQYHPAFIKLKELVNNGELGKINYLYSNRLNFGKIRREENILWSFAPHDLSMILSLINEKPESVFTNGGFYLNRSVADVTLTHLNFPSGLQSHIFVSWLHPYKKQELVVVGDKKMAVFDDTKVWEEKLAIYPHELSWYNRVPVANKKEAKFIPIEESEPLKNEILHFIDCINTRKKPKTDVMEGLAVLEILEASQKSLDEGKVIFLNKKEKESHYFVHSSSYVDINTKIGSGTKIWHFSHIMSGAEIGSDCVIGQNVNIGSKAVIGNNVKIQNNVSVYDDVIIEDDVFCGPSCVFTNVINPRSFINRKSEFKKTIVRKGATIGANATIVCGNELGEYCFIGAGAVVTKDVKPYALMVGSPAKQVGWVCKCGLKLNFNENNEALCKCGDKYRLDRSKDKLIHI